MFSNMNNNLSWFLGDCYFRNFILGYNPNNTYSGRVRKINIGNNAQKRQIQNK